MMRWHLQIADIKDDVDLYVEQNQEPDFFEDEFLYDSLDLTVADDDDEEDDDYSDDDDDGDDDAGDDDRYVSAK